MNTIMLSDWLFKQADGNEWLHATVPGDNFHDLLKAGKIEDPYVGLNEKKVQWVGEQDWIYRTTFELTAQQLNYDAIELTFEMLDTLCTVCVNDLEIAYCDNVNIAYTFDVKKHLREGKNTIKVVFYSPVKFIRQKQLNNPLPRSNNGLDGVSYIRKTQCHFGWDWGPTLALSGMPRKVFLACYDVAKVKDLSVKQCHKDGGVTISVSAELQRISNKSCDLAFELTCPNGEVFKATADISQPMAQFVIKDPQLWWPNGMTDSKTQPLYSLTVSTQQEGRTLHSLTRRIGLRTLKLDTSPDQYGKQFRFVVNNVPVFARGANWIPADSIISRFTADKLDYCLSGVRDCNMNMLRVWGGGYYESDEFYDKCDEYGILVWQDFAYACAPYPFYDSDFLNNCNNEAIYNIHRLRHHPSLALWCGNNELESCSPAWFLRKKLLKWIEKYFWHILPQIVAEHDDSTPYIPGSPTGSAFLKRYNSDKEGDTHLWAVWHGFKPLTYYRKRYTRFCSEFGIESLPDMKTIEYFAQEKDYSMNSAVFMAHQKCKSGNNKILAYLTSHFALPKQLRDLAYLSGIIQALGIKDATEHWRRNRGRCNGAIYWQLNDCWPVNSWAGMDYFGRYKPLQYFAKRFNAPQTISVFNDNNVVRIFGINDCLDKLNCTVSYSLQTFDGKRLDGGEITTTLNAVSSTELKCIDCLKAVKQYKGNIVFCAKAYADDGRELANERVLFKAEKNLKLSKATINVSFAFDTTTAYITLTSDTFAPYVHLDVKDTYKPFSQNYFCMSAGETRVVSFPLDGMSGKDFADKFSVRSLRDITEVYGRLHDSLLSLKIRLIPINLLLYLIHR